MSVMCLCIRSAHGLTILYFPRLTGKVQSKDKPCLFCYLSRLHLVESKVPLMLCVCVFGYIHPVMKLSASLCCNLSHSSTSALIEAERKERV